jgi:peptidoglycan/xylan/chitin deacetylase (PgdA/CDA1 family)
MVAASNVIQQAVKASAAAVDVVRPPDPGVVVLIYHRVGSGSGLAVDLPVAQFEDQMAWLAAGGRVCSLTDALRLFASVPSFGGRTSDDPADGFRKIVITFDDGTADFADHALPIMVRYGIPATLYAATAFIDEQREFPNGGRPLSWAALRDARATGLVDVGSHTHTHALLDRIPPEQVNDELDRSIGAISERLGVAPGDFAYPKALLGSPMAERAVRARFRSAAIAGTRSNAVGATDVHRLARTPIQVSDHPRWFARKASGGMRFEDGLRRMLNKVRYAGTNT